MKIGFTCSSFDLLHAGHTLMLEEAKAQCDYLTITIDATKYVVVERYLQLRACKYVDEHATEQDLEDILSGMHIDVRILGVEYRDKDFTGRDICKKREIEIHFNERDHRFSSSDLRKRVCENQ